MTATDMGPRREDRLEYYLRWRNLAGPYFDWQVEQFRPFLGGRIADVGCGPGTMTTLLAPSRELYYLGVDGDPRLLEALRDAHRDPSISVFAGEITTQKPAADPLRAQRVDTIVCSNLIEHIEDDALALRRMAEVLRPTGTCACSRQPPRCTARSTPSTGTIGGIRRRWCGAGSGSFRWPFAVCTTSTASARSAGW